MTSLYELRGGEVLANTITAENQDNAAIAYLGDGRFVITWQDASAAGGDTSGRSIRAQIFNADGSKSGAELLVNTVTAGDQREPVVSALAGGGFAIAWTDRNSAGDGDSTSVKARIFNSAGAAIGDEFVANTSTAGAQLNPSIASLSGDGFVLAWTDGSNEGDIKAQRFDSTGAKLGGEFTVNAQVIGTQVLPAVTVLADGRFVVVWESDNSILGRVFNADATAAGGDFVVAAAMGIPKSAPHVAALGGGGFAVTWTDRDEAAATGGPGVRVRIYDSAGAALGPGVAAHSQAAGTQSGSHVTALAAGGFAVTWTDSSSSSVKAQLFDAAGARDGGEFVVNRVEAGSQFAGGIAAGLAGFTIVWSDYSGVGGDASGSGVKFARFVLSPATGSGDSITGTEGDDVLHGLDGDDILSGLGGHDLLDGGAGDDTMIGGLGDDVYYTDVEGDQMIEDADSGNDTVWTGRSMALAANFENLHATVSSRGRVLTGNGLDNHITGSWGNDSIDGGPGADRMEGGPGGDTYYVDHEGDVIYDNDYDPAQPPDPNGFESADFAYVSITTYSMVGTGLTTVYGMLTTGHHFTGDEFANGLRGNSGDDWLDGGQGADGMAGRRGNDTYVVDNPSDQVLEASDSGIDEVLVSLSTYELPLHVENGTLTVAGFNTLHGNEHDNVLRGTSGPETFYGYAGADTLDGGTGADFMAGGGGNDIYYVDNAADVVKDHVFAGNDGGVDFIYSSVSYTLGQATGEYVERLSALDLRGTTSLVLTGNTLDNEIWGNDGANVLDGRAGADILHGEQGDDVYFVDSSADLIVEGTGGGYDTVFLSDLDYVLPQTIERAGSLSPGSSLDFDLTGNDLDNELWGNDGANTLDGKLGLDTLIGYGGADTFAFTTVVDGHNADLFLGFEVGVDKIALDDAVFAGLTPGALDPDAFTIGRFASDAEDRILYEASTGHLFFDRDGTGPIEAQYFASLADGLSLTASDFIVI